MQTTTPGPICPAESGTQRGTGLFDEDVLGGTEDAHVLSVILLERPPAERQSTGSVSLTGSAHSSGALTTLALVTWCVSSVPSGPTGAWGAVGGPASLLALMLLLCH